ncbi:autotransporter outer membrane beta-barrel domain-containing protein [Bartonella sp. ML70XJBT.G]|uniref:autotransporter outer membrane beta-barrel domain-containing protein n=1 Tax=Bartonella sp. ML70XJBT.G TaxID=3019093 RepID=UPI00236032E8|nr:autotransporter outer membrane beta-barrel domain-containing protein [Bartonella sp. ML70XJBT.G]
MVKIFKNHLSLCAFTTACLFFVHKVDAEVQTAAVNSVQANASAATAVVAQNGKNEFSCNTDAQFFWCNGGSRGFISHKTYQKTKDNTKEAAIRASGKLTNWNRTTIKGDNITIKDTATVGEGGFWLYGIMADNLGEVSIEGGTIDLTKGVGVQTKEEGQVSLKNVSITKNSSQTDSGGHHRRNSAFQMSQNAGYIRFENGQVKVTSAHGVSFQGEVGYIDMMDSTVVVEGNTSYGFHFFEGEASESQKKNTRPYEKDKLYSFFGEGALFGNLPETNLPKRGSAHLYKTTVKVPNSVALYSSKSGGLIKILEKSEISGDLLLKAEDHSFIKVSADDSMLVGGVHLDGSSSAEFRLRDNSKWILSRPKNVSLRDSRSMSLSSISLIHLIDSSITFEQPEADIATDYQTLRIGKGSGLVYKAQGNARLYFNTYLNSGGILQNQKTDRLLIHGDVEGKTIVHVQSVAGSLGEGTGKHGNNKGISIIQVSGSASQDSFKLDGDYVALEGSPYQYRLRAYGPGSDLGEASFAQRLVEGKEDFWDFRLENGYIDSHPSSSLAPSSTSVFGSSPGFRPIAGPDLEHHSEFMRKAVVPQLPTYLLLPNSVFHAGLVDISNQNKQLEIQRSISNGMLDVSANSVSFLRGYGGSYRYISDLSLFEYGYKGDFSYHAVEAGILLQQIENSNSVISFGVMGSYGKLSLQPVDVEQSQESTFDKWTATAYGSMQHDAGFYVDGLLSYGVVKGDVFTLTRGKTATLKGNPLSVSLTGGKTIATRYAGFVVDPQVQVVYQHLQFEKARDIDNFDIEMGKIDQWIARVGGRVTKTLSVSKKDLDVSLYGKVHLVHGFEEKKSVQFKDTFQLGSFGSSLEAGVGFNAQLSQKFVLNADLIYQHKLTKGGFSGISFSGGLRYRF